MLCKNGVCLLLCVLCGSIVRAGVISVEMSTPAVPLIADGTAWGGGATFIAGEDAVNKDGGTFGDTQVAYLAFDLSSLTETLTLEAGTDDWEIVSMTLTLAETWYPHNASFYLGAGTFGVSMVSGIDWNSLVFDPSGSDEAAMESLGGFYHVWEDTEETWDTHLYMPTSEYGLALTDSFLDTVLNGDMLTLLLTPTSSTVGLAFFNQNWGGGPTLEIAYSIVPEPTTLACLLTGMVVLGYNRKHRVSA